MAEPASELARLKDLLLRPESSQLEQLQRRVGSLDERLGTRERLEGATADILVAAFREAESRQHAELARAVAPVVVAAIQSEIRNSRDMMVEALHPITGRLVAAAVADAFRSLVASINERVDTMMSLRLWRLRVKSWLSGRPLSEFLLAEATRPTLRRVLFLERGSGALLASWSDDSAADDRADLISGMIAAITEFSSSAFENRSGELRTIDMGASRILLHASTRSIIAGDFAGPLSPRDEALVHEAFARIAEHHHKGHAIPADMLHAVADTISELPSEKKKAPALGIWLVVALLAALAAYFGWRSWSRAAFADKVRAALSATVAERPHMRAFPLTLRIDHASAQVRLSGLAPEDEDADALRHAVAAAAAPYEMQADIATVAGQSSSARALAQLRTQMADMQARLEAAVQTQANALRDAAGAQAQSLAKLGGELAQMQRSLQAQDVSLDDAAKKLSGLAAALQTRIDALQARADEPRAAAENFIRRNAIFFDHDAVLRDRAAAERTVTQLASLLRAANMRVRIVGYASDSGPVGLNRKLALERVNVVAALLVEHGVDPGRIVLTTRPPGYSLDDTPDTNGHANRRVEFEPLFETEKPPP